MTRALPDGTELVYRWGYLLDDLPEEIGGGFVTGEFLLRSDGVLLKRGVIDLLSRDGMTWSAGPWSIFHRFPPGTGQGQAREWLRAKRYRLARPSPVGIDETSASLP